MVRLFQRFEQAFSSKHLLYLFLSIWFFINLMQGLFTGSHPDEAYYWIYSKFLDWGYFDHPPMVALYIKAGDMLMHNTLGLRLVTVITNTFAIYVLWQTVKPYGKDLPLFLVLFSSVLIFHVYGFITSPDAPLYLFTILFLYAYQQYVKAYATSWGIALGILAAALLLSKYHGVLVIFFILLSNLKLFKRRSFWLAMIIACVLFAPHVYWQAVNDFPSVKYHLFERSASPYKFEYTAQFFLDQLLMMGPLMGWFLFSSAWKQSVSSDLFLRALKYLCYGVFVFFFMNTFKGRVQAHWPLIAFVPLFILAYIQLTKTKIKDSYQTLFTTSIVLVLITRIILIAAPEPLQKLKFLGNYYGYESWAKDISVAAAGAPVIFQDGFQAPSYYNFYNNTLKGFGYNSYGYRKTQYDIWSIEDSLQSQKVLYVLDRPFPDTTGQFKINTNKAELFGKFVNKARLYQKLQFLPLYYFEEWKPGETRSSLFLISNPYNYAVDFADHEGESAVELLYGYYQAGKVVQVTPISSPYKQLTIPANGHTRMRIDIKAPKEPGNYTLFIAVKTSPFPGSRNSGMIKLNVK